MENNNNNNNNNIEKVKLPPLRGNKDEVKSSNALRRAKAKYYQKRKQDMKHTCKTCETEHINITTNTKK